MSVFHQMGHQSDNLLAIPDLTGFKGAILSPVNYDQTGVSRIIASFRERENFSTIFDPQLYFPRTEREVLRNWSYFPSDVDTVDFSRTSWWRHLVESIFTTVYQLHPSAVCSPVLVPRLFSDEYYDLCVSVSNDFHDRLQPLGITLYQTVLVNLNELADINRVYSVASVISKTSTTHIYLIFQTDVEPRRELEDAQTIIGGMLLINLLSKSGLNVLVGYCSSDIILWKEAGATDCASGKYFNLRRFTASRWDENEGGGGGQLPYWFEESLLTYLRESDITRVNRIGLLSQTSLRNPFSQNILTNLQNGTSWLGLGWRQYLWWFCDIENRLDHRETTALDLLRAADRNWLQIEDRVIILEERRNNGSWIRQWLRAVTEYSSDDE